MDRNFVRVLPLVLKHESGFQIMRQIRVALSADGSGDG